MSFHPGAVVLLGVLSAVGLDGCELVVGGPGTAAVLSFDGGPDGVAPALVDGAGDREHDAGRGGELDATASGDAVTPPAVDAALPPGPSPDSSGASVEDGGQATCASGCGAGDACETDADCSSGRCVDGRCSGGHTCAPSCPKHSPCASDTDCASGDCKGGKCN